MFGVGQSHDLSVNITGDSGNFKGAMSGALGSLMSFKSGLIAVGGALAAFGTKMAVDAVQASMKFKQSLADVKAVTGATGDEFDTLKSKAESLGQSTRFMITDIANAERILGKMGLTSREITGSLDGITNAARAAGTNLKQAAGDVMGVLRGWQFQMEESNRVADVMAKTAINSRASMSGIGQAMADIAPIASQMNLSLEKSSAMYGVLRDRNIEASRAGRMLTRILQEFIELRAGDAAGSQAKAFKRLGMNVEDLAGKTFPDFIDMLKESGATIDDLVLMFPKRYAGFLSILTQSTGEIASLEKGLENAKGAAEKVGDIRMDTLSAQLTVLKGSIQLLKTSFGDTKGIIKDFVKNSIIPAVNATQKWVANGHSLGDMLQWFGEITKEVKGAVETLSPIFRGLGDSIKIIMDFIWTVIDVTLNSIKALFVSFFQFLQNDWDTALQTLLDQIVDAFKTIGNFFVRTLNTILGYFDTSLSEITRIVTKWAEGVAMAMINAMGNFIKPIRAGLNEAISFVEGGLRGMLIGVVEWSTNILRTMRKTFDQVSDAVKGGLNSVIGFFDDSLSKILTKIASWGDKLVSNLSDAMEPFVNTFINAINKIISGWNKIPKAIKPGGDIDEIPEFGGFETGMEDMATQFGIGKLKGEGFLGADLLKEQSKFIKEISQKLEDFGIPKIPEIDFSITSKDLGWSKIATDFMEKVELGAKLGTEEGTKGLPEELRGGLRSMKTPTGGPPSPEIPSGGEGEDGESWDFQAWKKGFKDTINELKVQAKVFGDEFNLTKKLMQKQKKAIKKLISKGYRPGQKELDKHIKAYRDLRSQLQESVNPMLKGFASQLGMTVNEMQKAAQNVKNVTSTAVSGIRGIFQAAGADIPPALNGLLGAVKSGGSAIMSFATGNWLQGALQAGQAIASVFGGVKKQMEERVKNLKEQRQKLRDKFSNAVDIVVSGMEQLSSIINNISSIFAGPFTSTIEGLTSGFIDMFRMTANLNNTQKLMQSGMSALKSIIGGVMSSFTSLIEKSDAYSALQEETKPIWQTLANAIGDVVIPPLIALAKWIREFFGIAKDTSEEMSNIAEVGVADSFKRQLRKFQVASPGQTVSGGGGYNIPAWAKQIIQPLKQVLTPVFRSLKSIPLRQIAQDMWRGIVQLATKWIPSVAKWVRRGISWLRNNGNSIWQTIKKRVKSLWRFFTTRLPEAWDTFWSNLDKMMDGTTLADIENSIDDLTEAISGAETTAKKAGAAGVGAAGLGAVGAGIGAAVGGLPGALIGGGAGALIGGIGGWLVGGAEGLVAKKPTLAALAEDPSTAPEAVVPLDQLETMINTGGGKGDVHVYIGGREVTDLVVQEIRRKNRGKTGMSHTAAGLTGR